MNNKVAFLKESLKSIKTVGTFTRSSDFLCKKMIKHIDFSNTKLIVELGAGDGVITEHILDSMAPDCKLLSFEVNHNFCEKLRAIKDDRLIVIEDSAEKIGKYLAKEGATEADYIVSAVPFVSLPKELSYTIVRASKKHLKKGGLYIQVHYSLLTKKMYKTVFGNVDVNFAPINVPPAFVLVSEKE